ncbi:T7SS effector LXG polymorphic toxin [Aciduricibacillus chroicocephali]|uniref:T7SS effector LXG polymorphic toxin n=1 Tax=Aciduricibacillus chroicocephali TaxID=3054939 RepID=A0ABY9KU61_9BACI|nr:T7SS effector LXG polymorphic toxin [Bacillaceae bacterium 44XB]
MARLVNEEMEDLVKKLEKYQSSLKDAVYEQYKSSTVLSRSINLKGKTGNSMKEYMEIVHINLAQKIINVSSELLEAARKVKDDFRSYESDAKGIVGSGTLDKEKENLGDSRTTFEELDSKGQKLVLRADEFISTVKLPGETVLHTYQTADSNIKKTKEELLSSDSTCTKNMSPVTERINELITEMNELSTHFKNENGVLTDKVSSIKEQPWYTLENKGAFKALSEDDPFSYEAGEASVLEGQWVMGTSDKNYITQTGSVLSARGEKTNDKGAYKVSGEVSGAKLYTKAETAGGWLKYDGTQSLLSGSGNAEFDGFTRMAASGDASVVKSESTAMLGTDKFNGHVSLKASALSANGQAAFKLPKNADDTTHIALGGRAEAATVKASAGITLFGMESMGGEHEKNGVKTTAKKDFGMNVEASAGWQAGVGVEYKDEPVWKSDYLNINATSLNADLKLLLGVKLDVTIPTIQAKWPW